MKDDSYSNEYYSKNLKEFDYKDFDKESNDSSDSDDNYFEKNKNIHGIKNLGNNCYLNSGLQIFASCEELINLLDQRECKNLGKITSLFKNAMEKLLNNGNGIYNPKKFIDYFCKINTDFINGFQNCSQTFIRTLIGNINKESIDNKCELITKNEQYPKTNNQEYKEYENFIKNIYPESKIQSIFSGITKSYSKGNCPFCKKKIENYSFNYFIDQNMYLDDFEDSCKFSEILRANIGISNNLTMDCPGCNKEIQIKEETKIIKLPDILIFTLERYQGIPNKVEIKPDIKLQMKDYIDENLKVDSTEYELFAINIRFGSTASFGHEICQVKRDGKWYEINDSFGTEIKDISYFDSSYGLFYKKLKPKIKENAFSYKNIKKLNDKKDEGYKIWFTRIQDLAYYFFSKKNLSNAIHIKQGLYILSESNILDKEILAVNKEHLSLAKYINEALFKIKMENKYDAQNFLKEFLKINTKYEEIKEHNPLDFILILLKNLNEEYIKGNYNLYNEDSIKYLPKSHKEIMEYNKLKKIIFPQSKILSVFSSIKKEYSKGKCKCGNEIIEYRFSDYKFLKIFLDNNISEISLFKLLKKNLLNNKSNAYCNNCKTYRMKIKTESKFIKLGDILIISFENNINRLTFFPEDFIDLQYFLDDSINEGGSKYLYELFVINIKMNTKNNCAPIICKIKINESWYGIYDDNIEYKNNFQNEIIYNLFYRKI